MMEVVPQLQHWAGLKDPSKGAVHTVREFGCQGEVSSKEYRV